MHWRKYQGLFGAVRVLLLRPIGFTSLGQNFRVGLRDGGSLLTGATLATFPLKQDFHHDLMADLLFQMPAPRLIDCVHFGQRFNSKPPGFGE
jgi:hypothetical protein